MRALPEPNKGPAKHSALNFLEPEPLAQPTSRLPFLGSLGSSFMMLAGLCGLWFQQQMLNVIREGEDRK